MSSLTSVSPTYQMIDRPPIHHVAVSGVWCCWWMCANLRGKRLRARHRQRRARGRQDRRLSRRGRRREHRDDHDLAEQVEPKTEFGEQPEHVADCRRWRGSSGPPYAIAAVETIDVDAEQDQRGDDRRLARDVLGVLGLLVDAHEAVPAPVDEDREQDAGGQRARRVDRERREPRELRVDRRRGRGADPDAGQRDDGEDRQRDDLGGEQPLLRLGVELDADDADVRHHGDPERRRSSVTANVEGSSMPKSRNE